ncbi:MAG: hypothetical protein DWQ08_04805 [Proteobacteria bacterium]|nr:MAG: hypothetical protein DWQ08_04805 [Pseudomonadota bacterium]
MFDNQLIQGEIENRSSQPFATLVQPFQLVQLHRCHAAVRLAPPGTGLLGDDNHLPDRIDAALSWPADASTWCNSQTISLGSIALLAHDPSPTSDIDG